MTAPPALEHRDTARTLLRLAASVAAVTVLARIVGFGRILVFARTVGPTCLGDTYYTANTVPNIVFEIVAGGALASLVVPVLAGAIDAGDRESARRTASALLGWTLLLLVPVTVAAALLARPVMSLLIGSGHAGCSREEMVTVGARMLLVFIPQVVLYGVGVVLTGILQAHRRFLGPALAPLLSSLVVIGAYFTFAAVSPSRYTDLSTLPLRHELILSVGTTLGVAALTLPLFVPVRATRLRPGLCLSFPPGVAARVVRLAASGAAVLAAQQVATAVVLRLANGSGAEGAVVLYNLGWTLFLLPWAVLAVPLATTAFPTLSGRYASGDESGYATTAASTTRSVVLVTTLSAAALAAVAVPASRLLVLGAPGHPDPTDLARGVALFAPGLIGYGLMALLSRALYARGHVWGPAVATSVGWAVTIVADVALVAAVPNQWVVAALGAGNSIGMTVAAVLLLAAVRRAAGPGAVAGVPRAAVTAVAGGVVGLAVGVPAARLFSGAGVLGSLGAAVAVAAVVVVAAGAVILLADRRDLRALLERRARA